MQIEKKQQQSVLRSHIKITFIKNNYLLFFFFEIILMENSLELKKWNEKCILPENDNA